MSEKEKIRAEIVRRMKGVEQGYSTGEGEAGYQDAVDDVLSIIDSLPEGPKPAAFYMKPTMVPKFRIGDRIKHKTGLCPAFKIDRIVDMHYIGVGDESVSIAVQDNWELVEEPVSEDMEEEIIRWEDSFKHNPASMGYKETARHFANWQKQQMMKDAVKCEIAKESPDFNNEGHTIWLKVNTDDFHIEDKIKLIIIKED